MSESHCWTGSCIVPPWWPAPYRLLGCSAPGFICRFQRYINRLLTYCKYSSQLQHIDTLYLNCASKCTTTSP